MKSANMMVIEKLENEGVASFELTSFKKCESKLIKDATAKGFEFEVKEVYTNEKGREYVRLVKVDQVVTEEQVQVVEQVTPVVETTTKKFEAGKTYGAIVISTGRVAKFKCVSVNGLRVKGSFDGGKEKVYLSEPRWKTLERKEQGLAPDYYSFKADGRIKMSVGSSYVLD